MIEDSLRFERVGAGFCLFRTLGMKHAFVEEKW